jgi:hypothetical protein
LVVVSGERDAEAVRGVCFDVELTTRLPVLSSTAIPLASAISAAVAKRQPSCLEDDVWLPDW